MESSRAGLAQGVLGEELGLDAPFARANAQFHEQPPAHFADRPGDQPVGANRPGDAGSQHGLVESALVGARA